MNRYLLYLLKQIDVQRIVYDQAMESTLHVIEVGRKAKRKQERIRQLVADLERRFEKLQARIQAEYK
ncbi:hypothetical protein GCM10027592_14700 [Spirosoma flavus]